MSTTFIQEIRLTLTSDKRETLEELRGNAYGDLDALIKAGVFNFRNGEATLSRDNEGKLRSVNIKQFTYRK